MLETPNPPLNRYAKKRKHKWELKKRHTKGPYNDICSPKTDEMKMRAQYEEDPYWKWVDGRNGGYTYWQTCYLSGPRKVAKQGTNRKIRGMYRSLHLLEDPEDIRALKHSEYQKNFDYWWTIF